jgi:hypothetical protein
MNDTTYKYIVYLKNPIFPRKLANELVNADLKVIKIKDLQNDTHIYGNTYHVEGKQEYREPFKTFIKGLKRK